MVRKIRLQFSLYCRIYWLKMPLIDLEPLALLKSRSTTTFPPWIGMPYCGWRLTLFPSWKTTRTPPTLTWGRSGTTTMTWWRPTTPGPRPRTPMTPKCPFHHSLLLRQDTGVFMSFFNRKISSLVLKLTLFTKTVLISCLLSRSLFHICFRQSSLELILIKKKKIVKQETWPLERF